MEDKIMDCSLEGYLRRMDIDKLCMVCQLPEEKYAEGAITLAKEIYQERLQEKEK